MNYTEWEKLTHPEVIAEELGYEHAEDVPTHLMVNIQHKLAEMWINYKMA